MKHVGWAVLLFATVCSAQEPSEFRPAETNVWGAQYPRVDSAGRVEVRIKAPEATKVRVNFWSGPKLDMEKQADGFWAITTPALVPGLHYYTVIGAHRFNASGIEATLAKLRDRYAAR